MLEKFLAKCWVMGHQQKNDKTGRVRPGKRTGEEIGKRNQMAALRFKTGSDIMQTSLAYIQGLVYKITPEWWLAVLNVQHSHEIQLVWSLPLSFPCFSLGDACPHLSRQTLQRCCCMSGELWHLTVFCNLSATSHQSWKWLSNFEIKQFKVHFKMKAFITNLYFNCFYHLDQKALSKLIPLVKWYKKSSHNG